ncbi:MAG TPA: DUF1259 domain-containing protein [Acidobacteriota bacterium]|nr:DUF1259 domain-containing protein [Acidobacteriota bacterium]
MKYVSISLFLLLLTAGASLADTGAGSPAIAQLDSILGQTGKVLPGDVHKYSWPRTDLHVTLDGIAVQPGLALGSWSGFLLNASGDASTMGDLVLLPAEVDPVIRELQAGGIEILAVHNHLNGEVPEVVYVHFMGKGPADALAKTLKGALAKTKTPDPVAAGVPAKPSVAEETAFETIQTLLARKGNLAGSVLQIGIPRKDKIEESGTEIPASMGMANSMNFQIAGLRVAATGDFVLIADEVNPVIRELESHGIRVTALHTHMLHDAPHIFFMHFWALGTAQEVAEGLKAALSKINVVNAQ